MKKNFVAVIALAIALSSTVPASAAYTRDGGRDRDFDPIARVIHLLRKLFTPTTHDGITEPHP